MKTNNTLILVLFVLLSQYTLGQTLYRKKCSGKVVVNSIPVSSANVSNQSSKQVTTTDANGFFELEVREGDVLHFSAVNVMAKELIVTNTIFSEGFIAVAMQYVNIQLEEVVIPKTSKITTESIGVIPFGQKRYTQAERHLQTAGDWKPIMLLGLIGGSMPLDPLINKINGRTKRLKKLVVLEGKLAMIEKLDEYFVQDFYTKKLNIPVDYIEGFKFYIIENNTFVDYLKSNNITMAKFLIIELAVSYNEIIKSEQP
ncbi:hypothetical protein [Flavobacterium sp.]|uniref:hypothetical protein n=1 Tax=Flavobacterium sp. TaxID=239 RepID=UPI002633EC12|nr:hypothetical protein [Flavobacterium sp.]MDG2433424.1 hypothetical protein [Flavobacterium sp.]